MARVEHAAGLEGEQGAVRRMHEGRAATGRGCAVCRSKASTLTAYPLAGGGWVARCARHPLSSSPAWAVPGRGARTDPATSARWRRLEDAEWEAARWR